LPFAFTTPGGVTTREPDPPFEDPAPGTPATGLTCLFTDGFCDEPRPAPAGGRDPVDELEDEVVVVEVVDVGGGAGAAHDSDTPNTGNFTGNEICDNGVPAGTTTVNDNFAPPNTVTVTTHCSADADGIEDNAIPPATTPTVAIPSQAFLLLSTTRLSPRLLQPPSAIIHGVQIGCQTRISGPAVLREPQAGLKRRLVSI
jgi:hypothetical protein